MNEIVYSVGMTLELIEKLVILKAYSHFRQNKMTTAASLGIDRRTLDHRLEKYAADEELLKERAYLEQSRREEFLLRSRGNPPNNVGIPYSPTSQKAQTSAVPSASSGIRMESVVNTTAQQAMPMPERKEVQGLPSESASKGSKGRTR